MVQGVSRSVFDAICFGLEYQYVVIDRCGWPKAYDCLGLNPLLVSFAPGGKLTVLPSIILRLYERQSAKVAVIKIGADSLALIIACLYLLCAAIIPYVLLYMYRKSQWTA